jgi:hypothetical protein
MQLDLRQEITHHTHALYSFITTLVQTMLFIYSLVSVLVSHSSRERGYMPTNHPHVTEGAGRQRTYSRYPSNPCTCTCSCKRYLRNRQGAALVSNGRTLGNVGVALARLDLSSVSTLPSQPPSQEERGNNNAANIHQSPADRPSPGSASPRPPPCACQTRSQAHCATPCRGCPGCRAW